MTPQDIHSCSVSQFAMAACLTRASPELPKHVQFAQYSYEYNAKPFSLFSRKLDATQFSTKNPQKSILKKSNDQEQKQNNITFEPCSENKIGEIPENKDLSNFLKTPFWVTTTLIGITVLCLLYRLATTWLDKRAKTRHCQPSVFDTSNAIFQCRGFITSNIVLTMLVMLSL